MFAKSPAFSKPPPHFSRKRDGPPCHKQVLKVQQKQYQYLKRNLDRILLLQCTTLLLICESGCGWHTNGKWWYMLCLVNLRNSFSYASSFCPGIWFMPRYQSPDSLLQSRKLKQCSANIFRIFIFQPLKISNRRAADVQSPSGFYPGMANWDYLHVMSSPKPNQVVGIG